MLIIEMEALENGSHRNQMVGPGTAIPEGWLPVSPAIEEEAVALLPFIVIDQVRRGFIISVSQGEIPEPEPEPEPEATETQLLGQEITALQLEQIEQGQFATELELKIMEGGTANV